MAKKKGKPIEVEPGQQVCGFRMADGTPCILKPGHDAKDWWPTREHRAADGTVFTFKQQRVVARRRGKAPVTIFND